MRGVLKSGRDALAAEAAVAVKARAAATQERGMMARRTQLIGGKRKKERSTRGRTEWALWNGSLERSLDRILMYYRSREHTQML